MIFDDDEVAFRPRIRPPLRRREPEHFSNGDAIYDVSKPSRTGKIVRAGSEQSEVKWDGGITQTEINRYLRKKRHG